jgi:FtsH-binding integral membrane protein
MAAMSDASNEGKVATLGALSLYLDFINLFLYLLRFFGSSRD